jgi:hypothetical protein
MYQGSGASQLYASWDRKYPVKAKNKQHLKEQSRPLSKNGKWEHILTHMAACKPIWQHIKSPDNFMTA